MIGIIGAMDVEVAALIDQLEAPKTQVVSGLRFHEGRLCGRDVVVVRGGVGKVNAAMCAEAMILRWQPALILNVGVAGALTDRFAIGDVAIGRDCVQYDVDTTALGDPVGMVSTVNRVDFPCAEWAIEALLEAAERAGLRACATRIASGDTFNDDPADKRRIVERFGAEVCDMEGCPIAQVCWINGVSFTEVRGISDATDGEHSSEYTRWRDQAAENAARTVRAFLAGLARDDM